MAHVFGLTGGIASGKSTVAARFRERGIPVIDADALARAAVAPGTPGHAAVLERFGRSLLRPDGTLDRPQLAARVFPHSDELAALNAIVHPQVRALFETEVQRLSAEGHPCLCYEVPLLFENRLEDALRPVVLVAAPERLQIERALSRDGTTRESVLARIRAQLPLADKAARADWVIHNEGSLEELRQRADHVVAELARRCGPLLKLTDSPPAPAGNQPR
jgi:dephospho-CoA kinase